MQKQGGTEQPIPGSARFWKSLDSADAPAVSSLVALRGAGVTIDEAADLVLEAHAAAILDRIAELIRARGDGAALRALIARGKIKA